jgi:hypothetical protein
MRNVQCVTCNALIHYTFYITLYTINRETFAQVEMLCRKDTPVNEPRLWRGELIPSNHFLLMGCEGYPSSLTI